MTTGPGVTFAPRDPELPGQTVVVIGGSSGMGLRRPAGPARKAPTSSSPAAIPHRLRQAATEVGARDSAAFDATDPAALDRFFDGLPPTVDHVFVTAGGPYYAPLADLDHARAVRDFNEHLWLAVTIAQHAVGRVRRAARCCSSAARAARRPGPGLALTARARSPCPP